MVEIKKAHIIGIIASVALLAASYFAFMLGENKNSEMFYFSLGIIFVIGALPFVISFIIEGSREKENNEMFLEFSRNLVESVKSGTPISKSVINLRYKNYGTLTPYIQKLANQISIGIPVKEALEIFARDTDSRMIKRSITLIGEAEKAGGEIENILDSVAKSVGEIEKLNKERKSAVYNLVVQGYIIFFVFVVIMLVMQFKILPMTAGISEMGESIDGFGFGGGIGGVSIDDVIKPLFYLLLLQGFFTGLVIGKLSEGNFKAGIKHSFAMTILSFLIFNGAKLVFK